MQACRLPPRGHPHSWSRGTALRHQRCRTRRRHSSRLHPAGRWQGHRWSPHQELVHPQHSQWALVAGGDGRSRCPHWHHRCWRCRQGHQRPQVLSRWLLCCRCRRCRPRCHCGRHRCCHHRCRRQAPLPPEGAGASHHSWAGHSGCGQGACPTSVTCLAPSSHDQQKQKGGARGSRLAMIVASGARRDRRQRGQMACNIPDLANRKSPRPNSFAGNTITRVCSSHAADPSMFCMASGHEAQSSNISVSSVSSSNSSNSSNNSNGTGEHFYGERSGRLTIPLYTPWPW